MKPRIFCREGGYPRALALTYSFDPLFFERIILPDLNYGGSTDITVVGDANELQEAISRHSEQINSMGKTYLVAAAETRSAFHPKMLLRIGSKGALLAVGSGNLTFGGWGGNRELACKITLNANEPGSVSSVNQLLELVTPYVTTASGRDALARLRDYPWLNVDAEDAVPSILVSTPDEPLSLQLERRWSQRRFERVTVLTGSTDERGSFLRWCHDRFGVKEALVAVSPENLSFVKGHLDACPVDVTIAPVRGNQMLHAKFYWFEGVEGAAAIVGSANCSSAAWLRSPADGGNVEIVKIYDVADVTEFEHILSAIPEERLSVDRLLPPKKDEESLPPAYFIKAIQLYTGQGLVDVTLNRHLPKGSAAKLVRGDGVEIELAPLEDDHLLGVVAETIVWQSTTCLAKICVTDGDNEIETPLHWVDDIDSIIRASKIRPPVEPFKNLPRSSTSSEHDKVISDLAIISASIFSDSASYRDPPSKPKPQTSGGNGPEAAPVKPEDLLKSLNDIEGKSNGGPRELGAGVHLSMTGVIRALFEEAAVQPPITVEEGKTNPSPPEGTLVLPEPLGKEGGNKAPQELPSDHHRRRLREDLERFFEKLSSEAFSRECTASKLVQAASYPLAVALLGERGRWLTTEESRSIVTRVVDILLNRNRVGYFEAGLIEEVQKRYKEKGQEDIFLQVVGDGTLWVALLAVMARLSWEENFQKFERALNLHRIFRCDVLHADTSVGKLMALVSKIEIERARELIGREAPRVSNAVEAIENLLREHRAHLLGQQAGPEPQVGDVIWHPKTGWGIVKGKGNSASTMSAYLHLRGETRLVAKKDFFVNVRMAVDSLPALNKHVAQILSGP